MKKIFVLLILMFLLNISKAKDPVFSFEYSDSLAKNADAVLLFRHVTYTRKSLSLLNEHVHYALTILSPRGDQLREGYVYYDPFTVVNELMCNIYDKNGKKVRMLKSSEIYDYAAYSYFTLFQDDRVKYFKAFHPEFPYTIEVEYEITHNGFLSLSTWYPIEQYNIGIKETTLTTIFPEEMTISYREKNQTGLLFNEDIVKGTRTYSWTMKEVKPLEYEKYAPPFLQQVPSVYLAPMKFDYDGTKGEFNSWNSMGKWNFQLLNQKFNLSQKTKDELTAIQNSANNHFELIKKVYQYMQSKTRYVGIQLGIGGFKPMSPELVDEVGYGDCKALSYYTKALLNFVGVDAIYAIIGVDQKQILFNDFASVNQLNHAILCVPMLEDSIWLECTSQIAPYNHLFDGTTGRKAILVKENGGELVNTPQPIIGKAAQKVIINFDDSGNVTCKKETKYTGSLFDSYYMLKQLSDKELREYELKNSAISDMKIKSVKVVGNSNEAEISVENNFVTSNLLSRASNRVFLELNPFTQMTKVGEQKSVRRNKVYIKNKLIYDDEVVFQIPEGFEMEHYPTNTSFESEFGNFQVVIQIESKTLTFNRILTIINGEYEPSKYTDYLAFLNKVAENEGCKLILKKI